MLHISVSSYSDFLTCRRLYFYKRIKRYDRVQFSIPLFTGKVIHEGLGHLFAKKGDAVSLMNAYYAKEKAEIKRSVILDEKQTQQLDQAKIITTGMLKAYARRYAAMIRDMKLLGSEVEGALQIGEDITVVLKLDNVILSKQRKILHELKSTKYLTPEYVKRIQTDRQTAWYFHFYNMIFDKKPIQEVMYDVIRKPSIKLKKNESYPAFLMRLEEWYEKPGDEMSKFHIERFKSPLITANAIFESVMGVANEMLRCNEKEDYYQDYENCTSYYGDVCPYFELCHKGGETKANLVLYQIRKSHHVSKENKPVEEMVNA